MGSNHSSAQQTLIHELFRVVKTDRSSGCTFLEEKSSGREFMMKEFSTNDEKEFGKLQAALKHRQLNSHPQVLSVFDVYARTEDTLCSHAHKIFLIVEHPFRTLYEEVEERKKMQDFFTQNQVWSIVYSCCLGLSHLYSKNYQHEALSSNRIYIESQGLIKISDPELMKQLKNVTAKHSCASDQHIYLSPEQIEAMEFGGGQAQKYSPAMSDVFTLGVVMLEVTHLDWMDSLYENGYVSSGKLHNMLDSMPGHYSHQLKNVITRMVKLDPKQRIALEEIEQIVENSNFDEEESNRTSEIRIMKTQSVTSTLGQVPFNDRELLAAIPTNPNTCRTEREEVQGSPSSAARTIKQNRSVNDQHNSGNHTDIATTVAAVESVMPSQAPTQRTLMKPLQATKMGSNIAGRGLRLESNQFPKPSVSLGVNSPSATVYPTSKPEIKPNQGSLPSLLLPATNQPMSYAPSPFFTPVGSAQPMLPAKDAMPMASNNKAIPERNLTNVSYETSSVDSSMWAPEQRTFMKENLGSLNYMTAGSGYMPATSLKPFVPAQSIYPSMMFRRPSDPNDIYGRSFMDFGAYGNPLLHHQPSLPSIIPGMPPLNHLNTSLMSPSLMVGQFTFSTPSSSQSGLNPTTFQPQYTQPITHHTITFGDDKTPLTETQHYDELEYKLKQLNQFALAPIEPVKGPSAQPVKPVPAQAPAIVSSSKQAPPPAQTDKPLSDNTNKKTVSEPEAAKKPASIGTKPSITPPQQPIKQPPKLPPTKKPTDNSLKIATVMEQEDLNPHDQALKELLQAIDNPTIPKYQPLTSDTAVYSKSSSKKNIALDVVEQKAEDDMAESQKPSSPVSELQQFISSKPNTEPKEASEVSSKSSKEKSQAQSVQSQSEKVSSKPPISVTVAAVNGKATTTSISNKDASSQGSAVAESDNKSFKSSRQSSRQASVGEQPFIEGTKVFTKPSKGRKANEPQVPKLPSLANNLQVPLTKYNRDGSISFGEESDSKEDSQPPTNRRYQRLQFESESGRGDDSLNITEKESKGSRELTLSNFSKTATKAPQYCHEEYEQGGYYEGYKLNGMRHGFGKLHYRDGGYYQGEWKENKMDGFAKLYYQNGEIAYEGYWRQDQFHGRGKVFNDSPQQLAIPFNYKDFLELGNCWLYYDGMFDHDTRTGLGTLKLSNGQIFEGCFKDDYIDGPGKFYSIDGIVVDGIWKQSKLVS